MSAVRIDIVEKRFAAVADAPSKLAIECLALSVAEREFVCLFGPSGCGKTTLLNLVAGLDEDFEGLLDPPPGSARIGYVFQNPRLLPWLSVLDNVVLVLDHLDDGAGAARRLLAETGLDGVADVYPERLSLGMARRVALARAFAVEPDLLLMDEPFVSLDEPTARRLRALLIDVWRRRRTAVLFVTHNLREAIALADRIVFLSHGPARVLAEFEIAVPRAARDDDTVERLRGELLARDDIEA